VLSVEFKVDNLLKEAKPAALPIAIILARTDF
jgi:hypothetical protein